MVKSQVNAVHISGSREETKPIDSPISFPPVNLNRVIVPHYDALILTLCINSFDVHRVLVDPSSTTDLFQLPTLNQMKLSPTNAEFGLANPLWFQWHNNHNTGRYHTPYTGRVDRPTGFIISCRRLKTKQFHSRQSLAALDEGRSINISSNGQLFN